MSGTLTFIEGAAPGTPPTNFVRLYAKTDGAIYYKGDDGVEHPLVGAAGAAGSGDARQCALYGAVDSSGYANFLAAGAGLNFNVDASPTNLVVDFANGATNSKSTVTADASNQGSLAVHNINFIHATYATDSTVTWGSGIVPPQYGYTFNRPSQVLLHGEGSDTSTTFIDDFGNAWTAIGNAQIDTAQFKFGSSSILLDGTGDGIKCTQMASMGDHSWTAEGWVRFNTLPGNGIYMNLFMASNASNFGFIGRILNTSGIYSLRIWISSNGTSYNVTSDNGVNITAPSAGTWYHFVFSFDAKTGHYRSYWDGTAAHALASTARVCAVTKMHWGIYGDDSTTPLDGWLDELRFLRACVYPNGTTFTPSASAFTITSQPVHYFSIPEMKMYEATTASSAANTDPAFTRRDRTYLGEADTDASTVTAVRTYALRGAYHNEFDLPALAGSTTKNHNLGVPGEWYTTKFKYKMKDATYTGYKNHDFVEDVNSQFSDSTTRNAGSSAIMGRNAMSFTVATSWLRVLVDTAGSAANIPTAAGAVGVILDVKRTF